MVLCQNFKKCLHFRPLDRAVWWLEHVLRHPTLYAGKAAVHKLTWFQYFLLDIIGFILVVQKYNLTAKHLLLLFQNLQALLIVVFVTYKLAVFLCCKHKNWKRGRKAKTNWYKIKSGHLWSRLGYSVLFAFAFFNRKKMNTWQIPSMYWFTFA